MTRAVRAVGVVVPARNEQERLGRCVAALRNAARHPRVADVLVELVVVLDACADGSGEVASRHGVTRLLEVGHASPGKARATGMAALLDRFSSIPAEQVWLTTTDGDSVVPEGWLAHHVELAARGLHGVAGTVRLTDRGERSKHLMRAYDRYLVRTGLGERHPHVHGANLGLSAAAYGEVGGLQPLASAEDHGLWNALRASGRPVVATAGSPVLTSARRRARAAGGFATFLDRLESATAVITRVQAG